MDTKGSSSGCASHRTADMRSPVDRIRTIRLWSLNSGRELQRYEGHTNEVRALAMSPDGRRNPFPVGRITPFGLWDLETRKELPPL